MATLRLLIYVFLRREHDSQVATIGVISYRMRHHRLFVCRHVGSLHQLVHLEVWHLTRHTVHISSLNRGLFLRKLLLSPSLLERLRRKLLLLPL